MKTMTNRTNTSRLLTSVVVLTALGSTACDTYSRDDILFRRGVPTAKDLALEPPGAETDDEESAEGAGASSVRQGLEACFDESLRCTTQNIATGFNGLTRGLLAIVDAVRRFPATQREPGRRVWGPHFVREEDRTYRFEMVKNLDANDEYDGSITFCFHAARGRVEGAWQDSLDCTIVDDPGSGLTRVLSGVIRPGEDDEGSARSGSGTLLLDANRMASVNDDRSLLGVIAIDYDNTSEPKTISMTITDVEDVDANPVPDNADYAFVLYDDGSGTFDFVLKSDFHNPNLFAESLLETLDIRARWQADGAGRAEASASGGDIMLGTWDVTECWDAELSTTWRRSDDPGVGPIGDDEALDCPIAPF